MVWRWTHLQESNIRGIDIDKEARRLTLVLVNVFEPNLRMHTPSRIQTELLLAVLQKYNFHYVEKL